ncbi:hypothetical protein ACHAXR_001680 [Thalassiosira sp. AJA248-18]
MGSVFGKESVKEPPFDVLLLRKNAKTSYEVRKYGERYAASVTYADKGDNGNSPFGTLARYIGVFGTPENEGSTSIAMTAPVVMSQDDDKNEPEAIAMTAPVVMENSGEGGVKKMMFMLPLKYDDMSKIPKPTNPNVHIEEIPSEVGVVHRYNGKYNSEINRGIAKELGAQLMQDGVEGITEDYVTEHFQFWGYNPPFTIPYFRRNEVWLKLNDDQVTYLREKFPTSDGRLVGGSSSMNGRTMFSVGVCGLIVGAYAVGFLFRSRSQYRRL